MSVPAKRKVLSPQEYCPIRQTLSLLGKRWTILIIKEIYFSSHKKLAFNELRKKLGSASAKVLSERLKEMIDAGIIKRKAVNSEQKRVYYSLTPKGDDACHIIDEMKKYGLKWGGKETFDCDKVDCEFCINYSPKEVK
ncbi:HxlR-like helix-turn-helix [uncultured archaeon]|nr:HxlR-like helix-turn-helix [uncultured archaeon]